MKQELKRQRIEWGYAQMELASWWRRLRGNRMKQTAFKQLIVARKAVNVIKVRWVVRDRVGIHGRASSVIDVRVCMCPQRN